MKRVREGEWPARRALPLAGPENGIGGSAWKSSLVCSAPSTRRGNEVRPGGAHSRLFGTRTEAKTVRFPPTQARWRGLMKTQGFADLRHSGGRDLPAGFPAARL